VGIRLFQHDRFLAVANSNRFDTGVANATILDVTCPASARIVQTIPTGLFPREINVAPDDATLLLTNYLSETFQVIETSTRIWDGRNDDGPSGALCNNILDRSYSEALAPGDLGGIVRFVPRDDHRYFGVNVVKTFGAEPE
jgi:hypothetical protein